MSDPTNMLTLIASLKRKAPEHRLEAAKNDVLFIWLEGTKAKDLKEGYKNINSLFDLFSSSKAKIMLATYILQNSNNVKIKEDDKFKESVSKIFKKALIEDMKFKPADQRATYAKETLKNINSKDAAKLIQELMDEVEKFSPHVLFALEKKIAINDSIITSTEKAKNRP
ncbi:MAG: hypothetical protein P4M12_00155 [Gammaproteobacteria bacterium]|nr:hypothetical protein [Gammaproteobacteria bacterium]